MGMFASGIYLILVFIWFGFFLKRNAFNKRKISSWIGAIAAALCWPLGFLFVWSEMRKQKHCPKCHQLENVFEEHHKKVFSSRTKAVMKKRHRDK